MTPSTRQDHLLLVSPARGLYTTANHPCLVHFTDHPSPEVTSQEG